MNWLKKNWKIIAIIAAVFLIGELVYETVSSGVSRRRADALISDLRADNQRLRDGLEDALGRVENIQGTLGEAEQRNSSLEQQLRESQRSTAELSSTIDRLTRANQQLGSAVSSSSIVADEIAESNRRLRESNNRTGGIFGRYPIPIGPE